MAVLAVLINPSIGGKVKCCNDVAYSAVHVCLGNPSERDFVSYKPDAWVRTQADAKTHMWHMCHTDFCADGTPLRPAFHCGLGKCDSNGCNCSGGCRKNQGISNEEMEKQWAHANGLKEKIDYSEEH